MARWLIGLVAVSLAVGLAGVLTWVLVVPDTPVDTREAQHTPFHFGCRHHNHGPKWHADHGRILGPTSGGASRARAESEAGDLSGRSLTSGRAP